MSRTLLVIDVSEETLDQLERLTLQLRFDPFLAPELTTNGKITAQGLAREFIARGLAELKQRVEKPAPLRRNDYRSNKLTQ